ncbi:endonuclease/exonuclease/phosphatase family protein [Actinomadura darangshiensis]|uniref:Endonuclease/exonuclease/phosphatase family protein n=1 Tax=Actinomadura darangshiensis TaxID=705336 RepID=A0A4V6PEK2_9ACTN|nr:endonuclease/exonuclease/phosphatase family protein [Actinomadura darangshiensis]TDD72207.1 endonuclease/exonuclease/phosphatase family protein [Actinomadura darangshiensis]
MRPRMISMMIGAGILAGAVGVEAFAVPTPDHERKARVAAGAGKTKRYLQLNIAGNSMHGGKVTPAKSVVARVKKEQPYVVTLNEVCATQFAYLKKQLADDGYRAAHGLTGTHCKDGSAFGNVVLIRIASSVVGNWKLPNPVNEEHRRLLCVKATNYAMVACATHISYGKEDKAGQVRAVADRVNAFRAKGYRVILGGDFNLQPSSPELDPIYDTCYPSGGGALFETDAARCGERAGDPTAKGKWKLDYIFYSPEYTGLKGEVVSTEVSDHGELWGTATY